MESRVIKPSNYHRSIDRKEEELQHSITADLNKLKARRRRSSSNNSICETKKRDSWTMNEEVPVETFEEEELNTPTAHAQSVQVSTNSISYEKVFAQYNRQIVDLLEGFYRKNITPSTIAS